jgi:hypothetical protein
MAGYNNFQKTCSVRNQHFSKYLLYGPPSKRYICIWVADPRLRVCVIFVNEFQRAVNLQQFLKSKNAHILLGKYHLAENII